MTFETEVSEFNLGEIELYAYKSIDFIPFSMSNSISLIKNNHEMFLRFSNSLETDKKKDS